eukprot:6196512-Pleurochrysis_carterae.AAC.1
MPEERPAAATKASLAQTLLRPQPCAKLLPPRSVFLHGEPWSIGRPRAAPAKSKTKNTGR